MTRLRTRSQLALPITLLVTAAVAVLPTDWRLGWQRDIAEIVRFPLQPFTHAGNVLAGWLRPPPPITGAMTAESGDIDKLIEERDRARRLYHDERQYALELEQQVRELRQIPAEVRNRARATIFAYITSRSPASALGPVELKVEPGVREIIRPRTIAVYASVNLLGRVVGEPSGSTCILLPVTHRDTGPITARVLPRERPLTKIEDGVLVQLEPRGDGVFTADVDRSRVVAEGDLVRLSDLSWPDTAQAMVLGDVESIRVNDDEPLLNTIIVRPRFEVQQVSYVTLIIEKRADDSGADAAGAAGASEDAEDVEDRAP